MYVYIFANCAHSVQFWIVKSSINNISKYVARACENISIFNISSRDNSNFPKFLALHFTDFFLFHSVSISISFENAQSSERDSTPRLCAFHSGQWYRRSNTKHARPHYILINSGSLIWNANYKVALIGPALPPQHLIVNAIYAPGCDVVMNINTSPTGPVFPRLL